MSIKTCKNWTFYNSFDNQGFDPQYAGISKEDMENYLIENPMPYDPEYSTKDLIDDITQSDGLYMLPNGAKEETAIYIADMLDELIRY